MRMTSEVIKFRKKDRRPLLSCRTVKESTKSEVCCLGHVNDHVDNVNADDHGDDDDNNERMNVIIK